MVSRFIAPDKIAFDNSDSGHRIWSNLIPVMHLEDVSLGRMLFVIDLSLANLTSVFRLDLGKCPRCAGLLLKIVITSNGNHCGQRHRRLTAVMGD